MYHLQSFPEAIDEGLEKGFVVRNGLQDVPIGRDVSDSPLAEARTAQPEDIAVNTQRIMREKPLLRNASQCIWGSHMIAFLCYESIRDIIAVLQYIY